MKLPAAVKDIRSRYVSRFPVPQGVPGEAFEDRARNWSISFAEQVAFEQGPLWGMKRADPNRPISKDTIAFYAEDGVIRIWDLLTGTGTGSPRLNEDPDGEDLTGQVFVKVVATDHLGTGVQPPVVQQPGTPAVDFTAVNQKLDAVISQLVALTAAIMNTEERVREMAAKLDTHEQAQQSDDTYNRLAALVEQMRQAQPIAWSGALGYRVRLTPEYPKPQQ